MSNLQLEITNNLTFKKNGRISLRDVALIFDSFLNTNAKNGNINDNEVMFCDSINLYIDCITEYNSTSYSSLASDEALIDKGVLHVADNTSKSQVGVTCRLKLEDNEITKIYGKVKDTETITVNNVVVSIVNYGRLEKKKSMTLPDSIRYYYHGEKVNYNTAAAASVPFSFIILSKGSNNEQYEYAVIIDPCFSTPKVYMRGDSEFWNEIQNSKYSHVFKDEIYIMNPYSINDYNVVYFVSEI